MAVKTKAAISAEINSTIVSGGAITATDLNGILIDIVDSYEDLIVEYTTVDRDLLTPFEGLKIYNTTSNRLEYYSASQWMPCSQKEVVALDCSANPNYSEALVGDQYIVSVAGLIGGASGKSVYVGDLVYCIEDNAGGNEATVGTKWMVCHSAPDSAAQLKTVTVFIPSADVLQLFTTPIEIVPAVAAKGIQIVSALCKIDYGTTPYATNTTLRIGASTDITTTPQGSCSISGSSSLWNTFMPLSSRTVLMSDNVVVSVQTGNPTAGDSDISIVVSYLEV